MPIHVAYTWQPINYCENEALPTRLSVCAHNAVHTMLTHTHNSHTQLHTQLHDTHNCTMLTHTQHNNTTCTQHTAHSCTQHRTHTYKKTFALPQTCLVAWVNGDRFHTFSYGESVFAFQFVEQNCMMCFKNDVLQKCASKTATVTFAPAVGWRVTSDGEGDSEEVSAGEVGEVCW